MQSNNQTSSAENEFSVFETKIAEQLSNLTLDKLSILANTEFEYAKRLFTYSEENYAKKTKIKDPIHCFKKAMLTAIDAMTHAWFANKYNNLGPDRDGIIIFNKAFFLFGSYIHEKMFYFDHSTLAAQGYADDRIVQIAIAFNELSITAKVKLRAICHIIEDKPPLARAVNYLPDVMRSLSIPVKRDVEATGDNFLILENQPRFYKYSIKQKEQQSLELKKENQFILRIWLPDEKLKSKGRISFESSRISTKGSLWQTPIVADEKNESPIYLNDYASLSISSSDSKEMLLKNNYKKNSLDFFTKKLQETDLDYLIPDLVKMIAEYNFDDPVTKIAWLKKMDFRIENRSPTFTFCFYDFDHESFWLAWQYCLISYFKHNDWIKMNDNYVVKNNGTFLDISGVITNMLYYSTGSSCVIGNLLDVLADMKSDELKKYPYVKDFVNPHETPLDNVLEHIERNNKKALKL